MQVFCLSKTAYHRSSGKTTGRTGKGAHGNTRRLHVERWQCKERGVKWRLGLKPAYVCKEEERLKRLFRKKKSRGFQLTTHAAEDHKESRAGCGFTGFIRMWKSLYIIKKKRNKVAPMVSDYGIDYIILSNLYINHYHFWAMSFSSPHCTLMGMAIVKRSLKEVLIDRWRKVYPHFQARRKWIPGWTRHSPFHTHMCVALSPCLSLINKLYTPQPILLCFFCSNYYRLKPFLPCHESK